MILSVKGESAFEKNKCSFIYKCISLCRQTLFILSWIIEEACYITLQEKVFMFVEKGIAVPHAAPGPWALLAEQQHLHLKMHMFGLR